MLHAIDNILYRGNLRLGRMNEVTPDTTTLMHGTANCPPEGEFAQLTGTLYVFNSPADGMVFYTVMY